MTTSTALAYASPADVATYGEYRITRDDRPLYRFTDRIGRGDLTAEPGRYHLYSSWSCRWAHRTTLVVALAGLQDVVSVSYVDNRRDARGWAFRPATGPDPVNGFTLLREAYEATEPGFDGHVSVPTLWDRATGRIAANDCTTLDIDLASQFLPWSATGLDLYPDDLRGEIDALERWLGRGTDREALVTLDRSLDGERYLLGDRLTLADVRLFATLVRHTEYLPDHPDLWAYARNLYQHNAFRENTDLSGSGLDWDEPAVRYLRAS